MADCVSLTPKAGEVKGRFAAGQIQGDRSSQEDDFGLLEVNTATDEKQILMVLTDGMGGHSGGGVASSIVTRTFLEIFERSHNAVATKLEKALLAANRALAQAIENNKNLSGMGTTIVAVVVSSAGLEWVSVGDSPLWLFRDGQLTRLNEDHSMAPVLDDMVATGRLSQEDKEGDKRKNTLRSAITGDEIAIVDTSSTPTKLIPGDVVVLASDGLETLTLSKIEKLIKKKSKKDLADCVANLLGEVEKAKIENQDNSTVVLYRHKEIDDEKTNEQSPTNEKGFWQSFMGIFNKIGSR